MQFYELARKEIGALILSDEHPNIVRCFAMEEDAQFVYLALERCAHSLADLIAGGDGPGAAQFVDEQRAPTPFCMQARPHSLHVPARSLHAGLCALPACAPCMACAQAWLTSSEMMLKSGLGTDHSEAAVQQREVACMWPGWCRCRRNTGPCVLGLT